MDRRNVNELPHYISDRQLRTLLPGVAAVDALEPALLARAEKGIEPDVARTVLEHRLGDFLVMPAIGPEGAGAKLVTVVPGNAERGLPSIDGIYVLFSREALTPELLLDAAGLTRLRTAA